ncbi:MAG TPA: HEAT repeat domain-containing protein [Vicinamibacterales bacterium]|nr:HEAT repeat domain-containing protein [Vicinamibacterales bacterium]
MRSIAAAWVFAFLLPQAPPGASVAPAQLKTAIDSLGKFDDAVRTSASATVRRAPAAQAVPALLAAASEHPDGYVRFRALVLLSGFNDPRARDVMVAALDEPNDRLRAVGYAYFEHNPEPGMAERLLAALNKEESEFVRPALTRALAAYGSDPRVQTAMNGLVMKGQDLFRSAVIEALGDYKAVYALQPITAVAKLDGPLQEDAILALGKIGDKRSLPTLAGLQQSAPKNLQPEIAAAICLLGTNCDLHQRYILESVTFGVKNIGYQELLRSSAKALGALAQEGHADAAGALIDFGVPARDPARSPIALAFGTVALRNPSLVLKVLQSRTDLEQSALLLRDAFDMLEEDFEEERFFATVRRTYWQSSAGSAERRVAEALIKTLEF